MKRRILILGILTASLAIGAATFATLNIANQKATPIEAAYNYNTYVKSGSNFY